MGNELTPDESSVVASIMASKESADLPRTGHLEAGPSAFDIGNRSPGGGAVGLMPQSLHRLARYVELAETGQIERLKEEIEHNAAAIDRDPRQIVLGAVLIMGSFRRANGKSLIPAILAAAAEWDKGLARIWRIT